MFYMFYSCFGSKISTNWKFFAKYCENMISEVPRQKHTQLNNTASKHTANDDRLQKHPELSQWMHSGCGHKHAGLICPFRCVGLFHTALNGLFPVWHGHE